MVHQSITRVATAALLGGVSLIGLTVPAHAARVLFSTNAALNGKDLAPETEVIVENGITQVQLANGAVAAFVDGAQFSSRPNGALDLRRGTVTVVSPTGAPVSVMMPDGVVGSIEGENASASFTVTAKGARGSVLGGKVAVMANGVTHIYATGSFWLATKGHAPEQIIANAPAAVPGLVRPMLEGGIAAAAENGIPVALGEALAAVGADGDIVTAAHRVEAYDRNPSLTAFPRGDYALLTAYAAQAAAPFGGVAFNGAGADIVRTYFQFLASGRLPGDFRAAYAQSLLGYLDLLRSGALPSGFTGATQAQLSAYIAFIGRTDGFGALSATNRNLLDAYLAFLSGGGAPDGFGVRASTLVGSYLDYLRAGGDPAKFAAASASVVAQYLAILQSGGIKSQLSLANRALLDAYLASLANTGNGLAFSNSAATSLAAFTAYLNGGGFPSQYSGADAAAIRGYLETLNATGLFDRVLGSQAILLRSYLVFLQGGGSADAFDKLPINVLTAQANALGGYYLFIQNGGTPSSYATLSQAQITAYLKALKDVGLFDALLGANARFLSDYYAYLLQGGNPDLYAGLPNVDLNAYAAQVATYVAYLKSGNLPSGYTTLTAQQLRDYLNALSASGKLTTLLGGDATFLASYLAYLQGGGVPDQFTGLPIYTYTAYSSQLTAFVAYLNGGGLPSGYTTLTAAQIRSYLETLQASGQLAALLGANANFFTTYLAYLQGGGSGDAFTGLPIATYTAYGTQLAAFVAYLNGGGLPSGYTALTAAQIRSFLETLQANGQLAALLGANASFFTSYLVYLQGGGSADGFTGLPIITYRSYATALNAFYVYLAGGGRPSGYTVLTAIQIKAYLDALSAAGQSSVLLGDNASFFAGYLTYLAGGGTGDQYAGLPGVAPPATILSDANVYKPVAASPKYNIAFPSSTGLSAGTVEFTNGLPTNITSAYAGNVARGTAKTVEAGGDQFMSIGRWSDGIVILSGSPFALTATQGLPYLVASPDVTIPTSVTIDYSIFAKTSPTRGSATLAPGVFDGKLRVAFSAASSPLSRLQVLGTVVMPDAAGATVSYGFGTQSAFDNVATSGVLFNVTQLLDFYEPLSLTAGSATNSACPAGATCSMHFAGAIAGPNAARIGLAYNSRAIVGLTPAGETFEGAVIFGANGTFTPGKAALTTTAVATGYTLGNTGNNQRAITVNAANGIESFTASSGAVVARGTAEIAQSGATVGTTAEDRIYWTRWAGGKSASTDTTQAIDVPVAGGIHLLHLPPATAIPVSGTAQYTLIGGTNPTIADGSVAPGTFTGALGVDFKSAKVGIDFNVAIGGFNYAIATAGKATAPTNGGLDFVTFTNGNGAVNSYGFLDQIAVAPGGPACAGAATCTAYLTGLASGTGASGFGVSYGIQVPRNGGATKVSGVAAFAGTYTSAAEPPTLVGAPTGAALRYSRTGNFTRAVDVVADPDGKLTSLIGSYLRGTATDHENGGLASIIGWTRWSGGSPQGPGEGTAAIPINGGIGRIWGVPATAVPTAGIATYDLAGSTAVTAANGSLAPGKIQTASLAVDFGKGKVGFESTFSVGGVDYAIASRGGVATPFMFLGVNNEFYGVQQAATYVNVTGNGCSPSTCPAFAAGFLAGPGASHAGISFNFYNPDAAGFAGAAIAFAKHP